MLSKTTKLHSENGPPINTPILIPSFSSKGWSFENKEDESKMGKSEVEEFVKWSTDFLFDSVLFSAYDLYYGHYSGPNELGEITDIIFIDSGGYEKLGGHDSSSTYSYPWPSKDWDQEKLKKVIDSIPKEYNIVIVNYDDVKESKGISDQVEEAKQFFSEYPFFLNNFLIKTEYENQEFVSVNSIVNNISKLHEFDIIGLTEKELGNSLIDRMETIARIRIALNKENIDAPLHIFGSLDPITSCLYLISGAEIFDGLTWLRYAYRQGQTIYKDNFRFLEQDLTEENVPSQEMIFHNNLIELQKLQDEMTLYVKDGNFNHFTYHSDYLKDSYDRLQAKLGR